ncbi:MAG: type II toxin-antitoxin system VapB family antitoxin [Spirochaetia bacterium]|nr:type II toxin-antitoxin system VapB family antitoxin [Spirochaetia bacterium]
MRTTINLNEELLLKAKELTHIEGKTELIHEGLKALIQKESRKRLETLGGTEKQLKSIPRKRL